MKQSFRKLVSSSLIASTSLVLSGLGVATTVHAGALTSASATLSNVVATQSSSYTIKFNVTNTNDIGKISIRFRKDASTSATKPQDFSSSGASFSAVDVTGSGHDATNAWTSDFTTTNGTIDLTPTADITGIATNDVFTFTFSGITNNSLTGADTCDTVTDSETCWIRISTFRADETTLIDTTTITYTVINSVQVTATVDPILTFTVAGVANALTPDANNASATSVTTTATTIPFGNVTLGTAKIAAQELKILTNANGGYTVYSKFIGGTDPTADLMKGTYTGNNIDPFAVTNAGWTEDGGSNAPQVWAVPTGGTKNVDTAWLGMRTSNAQVGGFNSSNVWSPPYVGSNIGKKVMISAGPDNGAVSTYVSYKIQANAYQPSDTYSGTTVYNVVASY